MKFARTNKLQLVLDNLHPRKSDFTFVLHLTSCYAGDLSIKLEPTISYDILAQSNDPIKWKLCQDNGLYELMTLTI